jgi:hypothetical protein
MDIDELSEDIDPPSQQIQGFTNDLSKQSVMMEY